MAVSYNFFWWNLGKNIQTQLSGGDSVSVRADFSQPGMCFAYLQYLLLWIKWPQTYSLKTNKHLLSHDLWVQKSRSNVIRSARVSVIWRSPGSGGGCLFLSSLMYMLAGSFSSLLVDLTARFLMTWLLPEWEIQESKRENDQGWSHCVFISWSWSGVPSFL